MELVPIHTPRPLRDPLRGLGLGCLRTRAMAPAHWSPYTAPDLCAIPSGVEGLGAFAPAQWSPYTSPDLCGIPSGVKSLGAFAPAQWSPYTSPDLCGIPSGVKSLGACAPAQSRELRGVEIEIPPYLPYPICDLLRASARAVKCLEQKG
jgi:hypothetical protein